MKFDLSKIFDLSKKFALSDTFLKLKHYCTTPLSSTRFSDFPTALIRVQLHVAIKQGVREMWSMTLKIALMLVVVVWLANLSLLLVTFLSRHTIDDTKKELLLSEETFSAFEKGLFSSFLY